MTDNRLYKTEQDVLRFFLDMSGHLANNYDKKCKANGIIIDSKLRREILCGPNSGKMTINGRVENLLFKNLGGGVWNCSITDNSLL